jgi:hypothetical protein
MTRRREARARATTMAAVVLVMAITVAMVVKEAVTRMTMMCLPLELGRKRKL